MKLPSSLYKNKNHDRQDEYRDPLDGRKTIGCLFLGVILIGGFIAIIGYLINQIR